MTKTQKQDVAKLINSIMVSREMWTNLRLEGDHTSANDWYLSEMEAIARLFAMGFPMVTGQLAVDYVNANRRFVA
jgi:hypothetical protein